MSQDRNVHDLMRDFRDEVPGYLDEQRDLCGARDARAPPGALGDNMRRAYELLVENGWADPEKLSLLEAWLADVAAIGVGTEQAVS